MASRASPNIIFLTWHDAGDWFGCYGHPTVNTPNVDRLATEGVLFQNNFSACAICSPSRASITTGLFCQKHGVMSLANRPFNDRIHPHVKHVAKRLKEDGYHTALLGVQHEAAHEHVPEMMAFDEQIATNPWPNGDTLAHYARQWIAQRRSEKQPFYLQVGTYDAHLNRFYSGEPARPDEAYAPVQDTSKGCAQPGYLEDNEAGRATIATLQGLLQRGDRVVGAILDALEENGLRENTLVVLNVDHGVGLHKAKGLCYDAGTKAAWILSWPGRLPAGRRVNALSTHVDVLPTVWEILGREPEPEWDGVSLARQALGRTDAEARDVVYSHMVEAFRTVRTRTHRLIRNFRPNALVGRKGDSRFHHKAYPDPELPQPAADQVPSASFPALELYDIERDPLQMDNLAGRPEYADLTAELDGKLWAFLIDNNDFVIHEPLRTPWQRASHDAMAAYCIANGREVPVATGPLGNRIDELAARGAVTALR